MEDFNVSRTTDNFPVRLYRFCSNHPEYVPKFPINKKLLRYN